jgi:hypothetical protein
MRINAENLSVADLAYKTRSCTKPGGWVEFHDWDCIMKARDNSITESHSLFQWHAIACGRRNAAGYDTQPGPKLERWVRDAGFVNVAVHKLPIPFGTWPKDKRYVSSDRARFTALLVFPYGRLGSLKKSRGQ